MSPPSSNLIVPLAAVNAIFFNENGEVLLTERSKKVREPGKWCLPGGHLDYLETWVTALRREVREEIGLEVTSEKLVGIYSDPRLTLTPEILPEGYQGQFIVASFRILNYRGEVQPNDEVADWDWFPIHNLPDPIVKSHPIRIQDAASRRPEAYIR